MEISKIKRIRRINHSSKRYDLQINRTECFFADNILVHNSKLTLWRNNENWNEDYTKNWVVSFKNQILYREEFIGINRVDIKNYSVGISQYALVHDYLEKHHTNNRDFPNHFPLNTEVFIEFIQNKLTTTRDYHNKFDMFLIASTPATAEIVGGLIKTTPYKATHNMNNQECSTLLDIALPPVVFKGHINTVENFEKGIQSAGLMDQWETHKHSFNEKPYETIKMVFLGFESCLGGKTEGVVLEADDEIYKFVQADQYSKSVRYARKSLYQAPKDIEAKYWSDIKKTAEMYVVSMNYQLPLPVLLKSLNNIVFSATDETLKILHSNKVGNTKGISEEEIIFKIRDDLFLTAKQMILRQLPENNNALIVGRFQPVTLGHKKMIDKAYEDCHNVVICIVKGLKSDITKNPFDIDLQKEMIYSVYPKANIIEVRNANLLTIINKTKCNINHLYSGSDRLESYKNQLKKSHIEVHEIIRSEKDISATTVRQLLKTNNKDSCIDLLPPSVLKMWEKLEYSINSINKGI